MGRRYQFRFYAWQDYESGWWRLRDGETDEMVKGERFTSQAKAVARARELERRMRNPSPE